MLYFRSKSNIYGDRCRFFQVAWLSGDDFKIHKRVFQLALSHIIRDVQSRKRINMKVISVHQGTMMLSAKIVFSQTSAFTPRCARIYRVVLSELAWWFSWWAAGNNILHKIRCSIPSHYRFQGMTSSSFLSEQAAHLVAAGCSVAYRGCRERGCHSDVFWQNDQAGYEETAD